MSSTDFREHGRAVVDWIADYLETVEQHPVMSQVEPGDIRAALPDHPPSEGESFAAMMEDVEKIILPGITHWQSPNFFGYFPANTSGPSILGELLSAGLGVQGMLWATSPACTELETHVLDWLVEMLGLPKKFRSETDGGGVIQDTASSATLCAMLAARERFRAATVRERSTAGGSGLAGSHQSSLNMHSLLHSRGSDRQLVAYTSREAHSSVEKAARISGIGVENLRLVDVDAQLAMQPGALAEQIAKDKQAGLTPIFCCATVGTTSTNAIDPIRAIGEVCNRENVWLHVDAAMNGTAALCPELRDILHDGIELADSYCFNPHKWMFTNFDCDCFFVADRASLIGALSILPEYLRNQASESGSVIDYRDWQIPLGRRFRALKLWFVIRHYGTSGLQQLIREHVEWSQQFAQWVQDDNDFKLAAPAPLNLVCFRHKDSNEKNERLLQALNESGKMFLTHTKIDGRFTLRMSIGQTRTTFDHIEQAWKRIRELAKQV